MFDTRHVEFYNPSDNEPWYSAYSGKTFSVLPHIVEWPTIQTVTIGFDGLSQKVHTVRDWLKWLKVAEQPKCIGIGTYQLDGALSKVFIRHFRLTQKWKEIERLPSGYDVVSEIQEATKPLKGTGSVADQIQKAIRDDFRKWVMLHAEAELVCNELVEKPYLDPLTDQLVGLERWMFAAVYHEKMVRNQRGTGSTIRKMTRAGELPALHELTPQSDSDVLEWATEILADHLDWMAASEE